jgi:WXG100 family type VII secretion target
MTIVDYDPEEMTAFLKEVDAANAQMQNAADKIAGAVKKVECQWQGDAQKAVLRFYGDWRRGIELHTAAMKKSAEQLHRMAEAHVRG